MADDSLTPTYVASPLATGQDGAFFEQHVDAFFLALLLVRGIPPIFVDAQLTEVAFQTERLGRNTDDVLLRCTTGSQHQRRLLAQAKRTFTISAQDEDCVKSFTDFWRDFTDANSFVPGSDALALITRHGTNVLLEQFNALLDTARVSASAAEFVGRLRTPGLLNAKAIAQAGAVRQILDAAKDSPVTDEEVWQLLRHVYVLSLDLNSTTCQTESLIRNMLALTAQGADPMGIAESTWMGLLQLVGREGMPRAGAYTWQNLPEDLRQRHLPIPAPDHAALRILSDRTRTLRRSIRTGVGSGNGFHIPRDELSIKVVQALTATRALLVTGPSGAGKSAVASEALEHLQRDHFVYAFRAEEFATAHLDTTLQYAGLSLTAERLRGVLAGQASKVLLVESVERLLEKETREAFRDLLALVRDDPSWQLILTCRDYSVDTIRSSFLDDVAVPYGVLEVPPLTDPELESAVDALPALRRPASSPHLRQLFRNPYVLDKASLMSWPPEAALPADERAFRQKFMREIVRAEHQAGDGMPQRRADTFRQVALRRARALEAYARSDDLDAAALESLLQRDLIVYSEHSRSLAAPAHDVLEDWAILHWLEDRSLVHRSSFADFISELGSHPALRRAYRKWLSELLVADVPRADAWANAVLHDRTLPAYFVDDTLVAVLRSPGAAAFLERQSTLLLAEDALQLRRVIHLIRVACKTTPTWLPPGSRIPPVFFVPQGDAWSAVLRLIREHRASLLPKYTPLIAGLLADWTAIIQPNQLLPAGSADACAIAHALLPHLSDYHSQRSLERMVQLLAMIPLADEFAFRRLLSEAASGSTSRSVADAVQETLLTSLHSVAACRDVPDAVIQLIEQSYYVTEQDLRNPHFGDFELELESDFGLKDCGTNDFYPVSALHGPFLFLLQFHPEIALEFMIRFLNRAADWYAHPPRWRRRPLETPWEIELTFPDGGRVRQSCSARLWGMYRGLEASPNILQCALMAFEHWLLQRCQTHPSEIEGLLLRVLRESQHVATAAVVASIAIAHPEAAGAAALTLLTCADLVRLDKSRMVADSRGWNHLRGLLPSQGENLIYEQERTTSDAFAHRRRDLEWVAFVLQATSRQATVEALLDEHHRQLPPLDQQTDNDRIWRIALQRMDRRQYTTRLIPKEPPAADAPTEPESVPAASPRILFQPNPFPDDIQAMLDSDASAETAHTNAMALFLWGFGVFQDKSSMSAAEWRAQLELAQSLADNASLAAVDELGFHTRGIEYVAAVCVRDHWDELNLEERDWSFSRLCECVGIGADSSDETHSIQRGGTDSARAAAFVIPLLLTKLLRDEQRQRAIQSLAVALTHAADEVIDYAVAGIRQFLWTADPELCRTCVGALAREAAALDAQLRAERDRPWNERMTSRSLERDIAEAVRREIIERRPVSDADVRLAAPGWHARRTGLRILTLLADQGSDQLAHAAYDGAVEQLANAWRIDDRGSRRDYQWESGCAQSIARFAVSLPLAEAQPLVAPLVALLERQLWDPVGSFIKDLLLAEVALHRPDTFWRLWQLFADRARATSWPQQLEHYGEHDKLLRHLFLGISWESKVRHWRSLDHQSHRITELFNSLPPCAAVVSAYVNFLLSVGSHSLPAAFIEVANKLLRSNAQTLLTQDETVTGLEILLQRYVYSAPALLKSDAVLRAAVLVLLDELVEAGSSAAYRMRDDFVTPTRGTVA